MTATESQQLWTSGGALVQRTQEPNIPFGVSLTSTTAQIQVEDPQAEYVLLHGGPEDDPLFGVMSVWFADDSPHTR